MSTTLYSDLLGNAAPLLNEFADAMNWMDYSRLYGDPIMATPPLVLLGDSVPHVYIEVDNGCPNTISDPVDCPSFMNGVLLDGLHAGMEWLEDTVFHISNIQMGDNPAIVTAVVGFADMTVTNLRKLNSEYLTPNIKTSSEMFWQSWQSSASSFSIFQITFTCCYILALLLLYIFVIRIMLKNMSQEMRRTSALVPHAPYRNPHNSSKLQSMGC
ncbi:hypothetical protein BDR26DRAFT_458451 [Obelidium mucronatum]|nr:hypothetical protein BDR26DRAFT_458451 [Obelidium mucronatum]